MMRRTPMTRTPWPTRPPRQKNEPKEPLALANTAMVAIKQIARKANYAVVSRDVPTTPIVKSSPVRSETYRRLVAAMPCVICGMVGYGQAAHGSEGKGMGIKASDLELFCLCADRPGVRGCHSLLDQGALFTKAVRRELEPVWAADTQRKIRAMGMWPKGLPEPVE